MPFDEKKDDDGGDGNERHRKGFVAGESFAAQVIPDAIEQVKKQMDICGACFAKGVISTMINYVTYMSHGIEDDGEYPDPQFIDQMGDIVAHAIGQGFEVHKEWVEKEKKKMQ